MGCYDDFHRFYFSLVSLECLIDSLFSFEIDINGDWLSLNIMIFELKMDQWGYDVQGGWERSSKNTIVEAPARDRRELWIEEPDVFPISQGYH